MQSWRNQGIVVDDLQHWSGDLNNAHLPTKGKANFKEIISDSKWQQGPSVMRMPRQFVRGCHKRKPD